MSKKTVKNYIYSGLGFPIELHNIALIEVDGEYHPKIDVRKVADEAIKSLVLQKTRLSGKQVKFIRSYFSLSLREFSKVVNESHMAIKKWENNKDNPTNMDPNIEIILRLHIYDKTVVRVANTKAFKYEFYDQFLLLTNIFSHIRDGKRVDKVSG